MNLVYCAMEIYRREHLILTGENEDDSKEGKILTCLILEEHVKIINTLKDPQYTKEYIKMYTSNYKAIPTFSYIKTKII